MRFSLSSIERAKRVSKSLKTFFAENNLLISLSRSQALVARIYGYRDWQEMVALVGTAPASLDDAAISQEQRTARFKAHHTILVEEGIPSDLATGALEAIHPTANNNGVPLGINWTATDFGFIGEIDGSRYRVRKSGPNDLFETHPWIVDHDSDLVLFTVGQGHSAEEAIKDFERRHRRSQTAKVERSSMQRPTWKLSPNEAPMTNWGPAREATEYAEGIISYLSDKHAYLFLTAEKLSQIPEEFRVYHEDGDSDLYLEQDAGQVILLCFPDILTASERTSAEKQVRRYFPHSWKRLNGDISPDTVRKARKEIAGPREEWCWVKDEVDEDGSSVQIHARRNSYWGLDSQEVMERDRDTTFVFRVSKAEHRRWAKDQFVSMELESDHHPIIARY